MTARLWLGEAIWGRQRVKHTCRPQLLFSYRDLREGLGAGHSAGARGRELRTSRNPPYFRFRTEKRLSELFSYVRIASFVRTDNFTVVDSKFFSFLLRLLCRRWTFVARHLRQVRVIQAHLERRYGFALVGKAADDKGSILNVPAIQGEFKSK